MNNEIVIMGSWDVIFYRRIWTWGHCYKGDKTRFISMWFWI